MDEADNRHFDRKLWDLNFRAELYQAEFFATDGWAAGRDHLVPAWDSGARDTSITTELAHLRSLKKDERSAHAGEIIRELQVPVIIGYWYELLKIGPKSHPLTDELLHASIYLAGAVATYAKRRFNRARPWALAPDLLPPSQLLPGLPAYPGGHAAQVHLMALVLTSLVPDKARQGKIEKVADNVALNRERGGFNYPSDTVAGKLLASRIFGILTKECPLFQATLNDAAKEWTPAASPDRNVLEKSGLPT
jgi:hypothetical protein